MTPNPPKIKKLYSFIAHDQSTPMKNDMAQAIFSHACQNIRQKEPEFNQLLIQVEKENTPFVIGSGTAKDEKGVTVAFDEWLKSQGMSIEDDVGRKISIFQGQVQDRETMIPINWMSLFYFDLEE